MKKCITDFEVVESSHLGGSCVLLRLRSGDPLPGILPGQFVQVRVEDAPRTFLRRPISVHDVDETAREILLLVNQVGEGTRHLGRLVAGSRLNVLYPLGHPFALPSMPGRDCLLIGGGVGIAPLLYLGRCLCGEGFPVRFVLGGKTREDLVRLDEFARWGEVHVATQDGSIGFRGLVTQHPCLEREGNPQVYSCGPKPMMAAVARYASARGLPLQVSLENMMACGLGACLCCVEDTVRGHECVCTSGPVFDIKDLKWQI